LTAKNYLLTHLLTRSTAIARKSTVPPTSEDQRPTSSHREKSICQRWRSSMHAMLTERCFESYNER